MDHAGNALRIRGTVREDEVQLKMSARAPSGLQHMDRMDAIEGRFEVGVQDPPSERKVAECWHHRKSCFGELTGSADGEGRNADVAVAVLGQLERWRNAVLLPLS